MADDCSPMAIYLRRNALQSRLKALLVTRKLSFVPDRNCQPSMVPTSPTLKDLTFRITEKCESLAQTDVEKAHKPPNAELGSHSMRVAGEVDVSKWRKLDSRTLGISRTKISPSSWAVLKILQGEGFDTYLVGGCVRDLLLNKVPKDFDVITTASLKQIKKLFHRCLIVGRRFPICLVSMKGCPIEVSSFETAAKHSNGNQELVPSQVPCGCDRKDLTRWKNSLHRDFTINSLFYDPFVNKVYDYANGMMDLKSLKLRTLIPAQVSFEEDCARILRGLRIAARLGLSFSDETETAIRKLSSSVTGLAKARLMMEMNYMLSYGAARPSLSLLWRFNLLELLLPFQAAYLNEQARKGSCQSSAMLMELFSNLDKLLTCDQPSDSNLWIGLLAFHTALVNKPQDALVVWTFASVLYYRTWEKAVQFAQGHAQAATNFLTEIPEARNVLSDEELADRVTQLAYLVQYSIGSLVDKDTLMQSMSRFPGSQGSDLVFISQNAGYNTSRLFRTLVAGVETNNQGRNCYKIDYQLLKKGDLHETSFVLGKVIMDTLNSGVYQAGKVVEEETDFLRTFNSNQKVPTSVEPVQERAKKQKMIGEMVNLIGDVTASKSKEAIELNNCQDRSLEAVNNGLPSPILESDQDKKKKNKGVKNKKRDITENECPEVKKKGRKVKKESGCTDLDEVTPKPKKKARLVKPLKVTEERQGTIELNNCQGFSPGAVNNALSSSIEESNQEGMKKKGVKKQKRDISENECQEVSKKRQKLKKESGCTDLDEVATKSKKKPLKVMEERQGVIELNSNGLDSSLEVVNNASPSSNASVISSGSNKISKQKRRVSKKNSASEVASLKHQVVKEENAHKDLDGRSQKEQNEDQSASEEAMVTQMNKLDKEVRKNSHEVKGSSQALENNTKKDESDKKRSWTVLSSLFK